MSGYIKCVCFPVGYPYVTWKMSKIKDHMTITQTSHLTCMSCYNKGNMFWIVQCTSQFNYDTNVNLNKNKNRTMISG